MSGIDLSNLLKERGLTLADLSVEEYNALSQMASAADDSKLTPESTRSYLRSLISQVERELVATDEFEYFFGGLFRRRSWKQVMLKARLYNYMIFEQIFTSPANAKKDLAAAMTKLPNKLKGRAR